MKLRKLCEKDSADIMVRNLIQELCRQRDITINMDNYISDVIDVDYIDLYICGASEVNININEVL